MENPKVKKTMTHLTFKDATTFKSHYSIGKSILTLEEEGSSVEDGPQSIIDLCKKHDMGGVVFG